MKSRILTAVFALLTLTAFAFKGEKTTLKEVTVAGNFKTITVANNINLVLVPASGISKVLVAGEEAKIKEVTISVANNKMTISSSKTVNPGSVTVYVPVTDLTYIKLGNGASVSSEGALKINDLTVFVNVDSRMELKTIGNINVTTADDCEFVYEKKQITKLKQAK